MSRNFRELKEAETFPNVLVPGHRQGKYLLEKERVKKKMLK